MMRRDAVWLCLGMSWARGVKMRVLGNGCWLQVRVLWRSFNGDLISISRRLQLRGCDEYISLTLLLLYTNLR